MIKKNDVLTEYVVDIGSNGEGIVKKDGLVIFLPFALIGEKVTFKVLKVNSKIAYGKLLEVISPSQERVNAICPVFTKCGGCSVQHLNYDSQLKFKKDNVVNCFNKIAGLKVGVDQCVCSDNQFRYRNKLQLPVSFNGERTIIGFYAENSHRVVEIKDCPINKEYTKTIIEIFNNFILENSFKGYSEITNSGDIREITVKEISGNLIITVVWIRQQEKGIKGLINALKLAFGDNFSLFYNENNKNTNVIYGEKFFLKHGLSEYTATRLGIKYSSGVLSFMQVNDNVCDKLYSYVVEQVKGFAPDTVIDAYSGAGLMTALLSKTAKKAIGIEIVKEATACADLLAKNNGLQDKMFNLTGACEDLIPSVINKEKEMGNKVAIVLDPPRKGCDVNVINAILKSDIDKIVYVSCMPSTLARDVGLLLGSLKQVDGKIEKVDNYIPKYSINSIKTFDMFPQTKHVETVVVLEKN